ncbi:helix-turn-helix domain-containing protein [Desulfurispira natronophila]|uniref:Transcriptional regulator with XRE-family HTH domain n=1 Tax=Desulfurispira natronophila TaxID=682562 RepID=A0A7W7Y3H1_9BACT|nr:helix-turn-helix transcriptional regulator [Desulfurispira natronophila]MBB5021349.1 transcriptional regulator with XRE-family HTH domain [Desulfurispira natronophila]
MTIGSATPPETQRDLQQRFRERRLQMRLTQEGLAQRSGVSLGSLKRFEHTGQISLESLLKLALVLNCLDDFSAVCDTQNPSPRSLDELLAASKTPKRGSRT